MKTHVLSGVFTMITCTFFVSSYGNQSQGSFSQIKPTNGKKDYQYFVPVGDIQDSSVPVITSKSRTSKCNSYFLTWNPGFNLTSVKFYKIRYRKDSALSWKYVTVLSNSTALELNGLDSASIYEVQMVEVLQDNQISQLAMSSFRTGNAKSSSKMPTSNSTFAFPSEDFIHPSFPVTKGNRKSSHRKSNHTHRAQVPGAPSLPFVTDTSTTSVSLTWHPRSNGGSPITGYKIQIRIVGTGRSKWKTRKGILPSDTRTYNINDLERGAQYKFRIIALNAIGESQPSQSTRPHSTTSGDRKELLLPPQITRVLMDNGSLVIHWKYDEIEESLYDGFLLKYSTEEHRKKKRVRNPFSTSYAIADPNYGVMYSVKLQAYNSMGNSPESHTVKFKIVRNHAEKRDEVEFKSLLDLQQMSNHPTSGKTLDVADDASYSPAHNNNVKARSSRRDSAFIIAGASVGAVILFLIITGVVYQRNVSLMQKKKKAGAVQNGNQENSHLCSKVGSYLCCRSEKDKEQPQYPQISRTSQQCSCYSGTSSPPGMNGSRLQSNRTSMSHSVAPENGFMPCSPYPSNPMYTVYYDYRSGRPPPCCSPPGIPLWWVRGADGEFCHIVPHNAKPRPKTGEECFVKSVDERPEGADVPTTSGSSTTSTSPHSGNSGDEEEDPLLRGQLDKESSEIKTRNCNDDKSEHNS